MLCYQIPCCVPSSEGWDDGANAGNDNDSHDGGSVARDSHGSHIGSIAGNNGDSVGKGGDDINTDHCSNGNGCAVDGIGDGSRSECGNSEGSDDGGDGDEDSRKGGYPFGDGNGDNGKDWRFSSFP